MYRGCDEQMVSFIKSIFRNFFGHYISADITAKMIQKSTNLLPPEIALRYLLELDNHLYSLLGQASVRYGLGVHSKHRHIKYHDFFIANILPNEIVLDLGCGNGSCAYDIISSVSGCHVIGIDNNHSSIEYATLHYPHDRLIFQFGDIMGPLPSVEKPVVVLSNVLEHLPNRVDFLIHIQTSLNPIRFLIRVPIYERDWRVPLKEELNIDYRLDPTHFIEYRKREFETEINDAGLIIEKIEYIWGEIWCVARKPTLPPIHSDIDEDTTKL